MGESECACLGPTFASIGRQLHHWIPTRCHLSHSILQVSIDRARLDWIGRRPRSLDMSYLDVQGCFPGCVIATERNGDFRRHKLWFKIDLNSQRIIVEEYQTH